MSLAKLALLQREARKGGYAVPHLLGSTLEMVIAEVGAAETRTSPLALGFAPEVFPMVPLEIIFPVMMGSAAAARIPVAVQLEHGKDFETIARAIRIGVTSVMFDGSALPYEENVRTTREIVRMGHAFDVSVEGELGSVGGSALRDAAAPGGRLTEPAMVVDFVTRTGVDSLAISFGNIHGRYESAPVLDYGLVRDIASLVDTPLVMHGGSGLTALEYKRCIESGISNIHFYTGIAVGVWDHLKRAVERAAGDPVYHEMVASTIEYFHSQTLKVIDMLGSAGKGKAP